MSEAVARETVDTAPNRLVAPASFTLESRLIALVVAVIVSGTVFASWLRGDEDITEPLFDWQLSAFYDLNAADQAVYNALLVASEELWYAHGDMLTFGSEEQRAKPWPSAAELDEFYLIPPFVRDVAWQQQGEVEWELIAWYGGERLDGSTVYFGSNGKLEDQSAYLIVLTHFHKGASWTDGAKIWIHEDRNVEPPDVVVRDSLIKDGWMEVVPYSGAMEVERLKG